MKELDEEEEEEEVTYIAEVQLGVLGVEGKEVAGAVVGRQPQRLAWVDLPAVDDDDFLK